MTIKELKDELKNAKEIVDYKDSETHIAVRNTHVSTPFVCEEFTNEIRLSTKIDGFNITLIKNIKNS